METSTKVAAPVAAAPAKVVKLTGFAVITPCQGQELHIAEPAKFARMVKQGLGITDAHEVLEFTEASVGKCPTKPRPMTKAEVGFVMKMMLSEMVELAQTVCDDAESSIEFVKECMGVDIKHNYKKPTTEVGVIAAQADSIIDAYYYGLNALCKVGVNGSEVFDVVSGANLAKKFPDGTYHKNELGKVIKPVEYGWKDPDVEAVITRQMNEGTWSVPKQ